jgi:hypothetical protein
MPAMPSISLNDQVTPFSAIAAPLPVDGDYLSDWPDQYMKIAYR